MVSAIEIKDKKVIELMIPIKSVFMIDYDEVLDKFKLNLILDKGYSRIPVCSNHDRNDLNGLVRIKSLIGVDFNQNKTLKQLGVELKKPLVISPRLTMIELLREFRKGKSHMAFITEQVEELQNKLGLNRTNSIQKEHSGIRTNDPVREKDIKILGIITLEDVIEKMINLDILDEDDYENINKNKRKTQPRFSKRSVNSVDRQYSKKLAESFIKEESFKIDSILKESFSKKKSIKDMFFNKNSYNNSMTPKSLKDPFI
jgi:metal transporter CNNM